MGLLCLEKTDADRSEKPAAAADVLVARSADDQISLDRDPLSEAGFKKVADDKYILQPRRYEFGWTREGER
jgi:hypothetical protein